MNATGLILGVESSCDETAAAVVDNNRNVRSSVIASQDDLHAGFGGVVPEIASRAHVERILPVVTRALADAGVSLHDLDAIAVGNRPGLIGSLLVGVAASKALAWSLGKPLIGIDHVRAHLYAGALGRDKPALPALGLVVSGGHTVIYRVESWLDMRRLGSTIDDAIGEAFDKAAAVLGMPYPGGPKLDALAQTGDEHAHDFPVSLLGADTLDFSYSGLKTAVLYTVRGRPVRDAGVTRFPRDHTDLTNAEKANIAASFQEAAIHAVLIKLRRALERPLDADGSYRSLLIGGGVSANSRLRAALLALADESDLDLRLPDMRHCTDNAAMIAGLAHERLRTGAVDTLALQASPSSAH